MRRPPQGDGRRPIPGNRGGAGAQAWLQALPSRAWGLPGAIRGLAVVVGVPAQAPRNHLRVPTGWALPAGNGRDRNFRSTLAAWGRGCLLDAPGGRRGGGGAAPAHPSGARVQKRCALRPCTSGRGDPAEARRGWVGDTCPETPLLPPTCAAPPPTRRPAPTGPAPPPAPGGPPGPARPGRTPPRAGSAPPAGSPGRAGPHRGGGAAELGAGARRSLLWSAAVAAAAALRLPVPVPRPPQPPPPPPLGGHCPFRNPLPRRAPRRAAVTSARQPRRAAMMGRSGAPPRHLGGGQPAGAPPFGWPEG